MILLCVNAYSQDYKIHILAKGETLYSVARKYDVALDVLKSVNNIINTSSLPVGLKLKIPSTFRSHVVQKGENLFQISQKYNISLSEIYKINNLNANSTIFVGDTIFLPGEVVLVHKPDDSGSAITWPHGGKREKLTGKLNAVAINAKKGDEFISVSSGKVLLCRLIRGYGYVIIIRTGDGYIFNYLGADELFVTTGQIIEPGTKLGTVGINSHEGTAQLFFSVRKNGKIVNPERAPRG